MDRLIQMIINQVLRHIVKRGVDTGINHFSGRGKGDGGSKADLGANSTSDAKALARKARQAANLARRMGR